MVADVGGHVVLVVGPVADVVVEAIVVEVLVEEVDVEEVEVDDVDVEVDVEVEDDVVVAPAALVDVDEVEVEEVDVGVVVEEPVVVGDVVGVTATQVAGVTVTVADSTSCRAPPSARPVAESVCVPVGMADGIVTERVKFPPESDVAVPITVGVEAMLTEIFADGAKPDPLTVTAEPGCRTWVATLKTPVTTLAVVEVVEPPGVVVDVVEVVDVDDVDVVELVEVVDVDDVEVVDVEVVDVVGVVVDVVLVVVVWPGVVVDVVVVVGT